MNIRKLSLAAIIVAALAIPSMADARGFGGGGGHSSFGGSHSSFSGGGRSMGSGWGGSRASTSFSRPSTPTRSFGSGWGQGRTTQTRSLNRTSTRNANNIVNNGGGMGGGGGFGGNGFFSGMMVGSMMSHPYGYGMGMMPPPYYMGGYGYNVVGGYGLNGYTSGGAYYPYSGFGTVMAWLFGMLTLFFVIYFTIILFQLVWRITRDEM